MSESADRCTPAKNTAAVLMVVWMMCLAASVASGDEKIVRRFPLTSGGRVFLENTRGDIEITGWPVDSVELSAETKAEEEEAELVPVEIEARDDSIRITSVYPVYAPKLKVRVDYRLKVPRYVDLKLVKTMNGDVSVSDVAGRLLIDVKNGEVTVKSFSGILRAISTNGRIEVDLTDLDEADTVNLENYNGDISLRLPRNRKAHWSVKTMNGDIDSTIPFEILDDFGPKFVELTEQEEPVIRIYTINGDIRITER